MSAPAMLITGFGPFPGVARNPSAWLVQMLARTHDRPLTAAVLPVTWQGAWAALEPLLEASAPRAVVMFGVSARVRGFCLERHAYNERTACEDATGAEPADSRIIAAGPETLEATLPLQYIASAVAEAGIPVDISCDPGRYLCNTLLYHALHWAGDRTRVGFVHIPPLEQQADGAGPLNAAQLLTGAQLIVETALRADQPGAATA